MPKRAVLALSLLVVPATVLAAEGALRMIAPRNQTMPLAQFQNDKLNGGIIKDLGDAIAVRTGRRADYVSVAGDQVSAALAAGKADGICYVRPFWIDGDYHWSRPVIPDAELVAALPEAPPVRSLIDLRDRPVGTVASHRYPRMEQVLGLRFQRLDAPTMEENLRTMGRRGAQYTVLGRATLDYQLKVDKSLHLRPDLVIASFTAQCAFTKNAAVPFGEINRAIDSLLDDGTVANILARYR